MPGYDFRVLFRPEHKIKNTEALCLSCILVYLNKCHPLLCCTYGFVG
jgi:hypothetical protein